MKHKIFVLLTISAVLILIIFYWIRTYKDISDTIWKLQSNLVEKETTISEIDEMQVCQLRSEHLNINKKIQEKIPKGSYIIRLHDGVCLDCYAECIIRLNKEVRDNSKLFILGSYHFSATLKDIITSLKLDSIKSENIPDKYILPIDSCGKPYVFSIDNNGYTKHVFLFTKKNYRTIKDYVNLLQREND